MNYTHRHTITSPLSTLAKLEAEANATSERAEKARAMLEDTDFHGSPEIRDFPTLRQAITQGTSTTTAPFKTALDTITHTADGLRLKRTDEPARVVDVCAYLQGVPECFYKIQNKTKPVYNIVVYNSFAWFISAEQIANRAAAIVALAKQLKATGASVALEIAYDCRNTRTDERARVRIPYSLDGLNLGQFAFAISPTFFRTFCLMLDESTFNYWDNTTRASSHTQGTDTTTAAPCGAQYKRAHTRPRTFTSHAHTPARVYNPRTHARTRLFTHAHTHARVYLPTRANLTLDNASTSANNGGTK